jgi:hypothetical protein
VLDTRLAWAVLLPMAAALQLAASGRAALIERIYSRRIYPVMGSMLAWTTGWSALSLAEWCLAILLLVLATLLARGLVRLFRRRASWAGLAGGLGRLLTTASFLYLFFLVSWGLNYQRLPLATAAGLDTRPGDASELRALSEELVERANALRPAGPEDAAGALRLVGGAEATLERAHAGFDRAEDRVLRTRFPAPKRVVFSTLMSYVGISGIYSPFTGEANVNMTVPDARLPFTACHEMAHQRGYAREDEANFLAYLTCGLHPDADFRYAGALAASQYATSALARVDRGAWARIEATRAPGVRRDVAAISAWANRYRGPVSRAGRAVNDAYLRSQGEAAGVRSYGRMVDLLLAERRARLGQAVTSTDGGDGFR